jgi:hypothetical protein
MKTSRSLNLKKLPLLEKHVAFDIVSTSRVVALQSSCLHTARETGGWTLEDLCLRDLGSQEQPQASGQAGAGCSLQGPLPRVPAPLIALLLAFGTACLLYGPPPHLQVPEDASVI